MFLLLVEQCVPQEFIGERAVVLAYLDAIKQGWKARLYWRAYRIEFRRLCAGFWVCFILSDGSHSIMGRGYGASPVCALRHVLGSDP